MEDYQHQVPELERELKGGENELVKFCETKGGMRVKEIWEEDAEAAANVEEIKLKELYERKKSMKSKKRKFELVRECQNTMTRDAD